MRVDSLHDVHAAAATLSDRRTVAAALAGSLAAIAPHALHTVTFFSGPASLDIEVAASRIGTTSVDLRGFARSYGASEVAWDRWSVRPCDRDALRRVHMPGNPLGAYWSRHGAPLDYRRRVICIGSCAIALAGSAVIDDRPIDEATWRLVDERIAATATAIRMAAFAAGALDQALTAEDVVGYLSPDGVVLAAANDPELSVVIASASDMLRTRSKRAFAAGGVRYTLRPTERVKAAEVFELVAARGADLSERDAELVDWVRRGLTKIRKISAPIRVSVLRSATETEVASRFSTMAMSVVSRDRTSPVRVCRKNAGSRVRMWA